MLIDMHAHFIPREFPTVGARTAGERWPRMLPTDRGARVFSTRPDGTGYTAPPVWWDPDERRAAMHTNSVDVEVISPFPGVLGYSYTPEDALDLSRHVNVSITEFCRSDARRFFGLGMVPMQDPVLAARELAQVKQLGLVGVEVGSNINGASLGDERFGDFFAEAESLGLALFVHGLAPTFADRYPQSAGGGFGVAAEIGVAAVSLAASGILDHYPRLRIALSHGGGGYPLMLPRAQFFWGRTWDEQPPTFTTSGVSPYETARQFFYDTLVFDRRALRYLVDLLGPEHLLIGTDHPAMQREQPVGKTLRLLGLSDRELDDITWQNCFRWLGVEAPLRQPLEAA
jgi:aminocarboxymuconate-semialdehyde decarboxylase